MHASSPPDAPSPPADLRGRDRLVALAAAGLVVATVLIASLVPASHGSPARVAPAEDATCAEWSDGCTICQRHPEGPACSMPGIACVREMPHCLRRAGG